MSGTVAAGFVKVASTSEIPQGEMKKVEVASHEIFLANVGSKYYAIGNVCTHEGGPLDQGFLEGHEVECPWHGSRFDLKTGAVKLGPAWTPEPTYEVKVEGTSILIKAK